MLHQGIALEVTETETPVPSDSKRSGKWTFSEINYWNNIVTRSNKLQFEKLIKYPNFNTLRKMFPDSENPIENINLIDLTDRQIVAIWKFLPEPRTINEFKYFNYIGREFKNRCISGTNSNFIPKVQQSYNTNENIESNEIKEAI